MKSKFTSVAYQALVAGRNLASPSSSVTPTLLLFRRLPAASTALHEATISTSILSSSPIFAVIVISEI